MITVPCVYYVAAGRARFFLSCPHVAEAQRIAAAVQRVFGLRTWIADWQIVAHEPSDVERDFEQAAREDARG